MNIKIYLAILCVAATAWSCAKEGTANYSDQEQKSLDAWVAKYAPDAIPFMEGSYYEVIEEAPEGAEAITGKNWVKVNFVIRSLGKDGKKEGDIIYTRKEVTARRLGSFTEYTNYVPAYYYLSSTDYENTLMKGLYRGITSMKKGEMRRFYVPSAQMYGSGAINNQSGYGGQFALAGNLPAIIDSLQVVEIIPNPETHEEEQVKALATSSTPEGWGLSEDDAIEDHYYFQKIRAGEGDAIKDGDVVYIYYTGKLLNGRIFDTNIDTVWTNTYGKYRIYNSSYSNIEIDRTDGVRLTKKADPETPEEMPAKVFSFILPKLENYGDSMRIVVTSRYAYFAEGRNGAYSDEEKTYTMPDYKYDEIDFDYFYSPSYYYQEFNNSDYSYEGVVWPVIEIAPFTPLIYEIVVANENRTLE